MSDTIDLISKLEGHFPKHVIAPNSIIFREGETGDSAYIVCRGEVMITTTNTKGELIHLTTVQAGQIFGELALFNEDIRSATALTQKGCELLVIGQARLDKILAEGNPFLHFLLDYLVQRVIDLSKRAR